MLHKIYNSLNTNVCTVTVVCLQPEIGIDIGMTAIIFYHCNNICSSNPYLCQQSVERYTYLLGYGRGKMNLERKVTKKKLKMYSTWLWKEHWHFVIKLIGNYSSLDINGGACRMQFLPVKLLLAVNGRSCQCMCNTVIFISSTKHEKMRVVP